MFLGKHTKTNRFSVLCTASFTCLFILLLHHNALAKDAPGQEYAGPLLAQVNVYTDPQTGDRVTDVIAPRNNTQQQSPPITVYPQVNPQPYPPRPYPPKPYPPQPGPKPYPPGPYPPKIYPPQPGPGPKPSPPKSYQDQRPYDTQRPYQNQQPFRGPQGPFGR